MKESECRLLVTYEEKDDEGICENNHQFHIKEHATIKGECPDGGGLIKLLEVTNSPTDKNNTFIFWKQKQGESGFIEFNNIMKAREAFFELTKEMAFKLWFWHYLSAYLAPKDQKLKIGGLILSGYTKVVSCSRYLIPWFFATQSQFIVGDYVFPEHLQDHPAFDYRQKIRVKNSEREAGTDKDILGFCIEGKQGLIICSDGSVYDIDAEKPMLYYIE